MTYDDEKPDSAAARIDERAHLDKIASDLSYAATYGTTLKRPAEPPVVTRAWVERKLEGVLELLGKTMRELVMDPLNKRLDVLEKAAGKNSLKHAAAHDLYANMVERVSKLESETRVRFMGIWQPGFYYEKGSLVTHDGSMWYCLCGNDKTRPGSGEGAGKGSGDWQLCVKRGRDGR